MTDKTIMIPERRGFVFIFFLVEDEIFQLACRAEKNSTKGIINLAVLWLPESDKYHGKNLQRKVPTCSRQNSLYLFFSYVFLTLTK